MQNEEWLLRARAYDGVFTSVKILSSVPLHSQCHEQHFKKPHSLLILLLRVYKKHSVQVVSSFS